MQLSTTVRGIIALLPWTLALAIMVTEALMYVYRVLVGPADVYEVNCD